VSSRFLCLVGGPVQQHAAMAGFVQARLGLGAGLTLGPTTFFFADTTEVARNDEVDAIVIGSLYRRCGDSKASSLSPTEWRGLTQSQGRSLLASRWGSWISCTWDGASRVLSVLRDPSGAAPCYYRTDGVMSVMSSNVRDLERIGSLQPAINWDVVADLLMRPAHRGAATGIAGVSEVLPGCMLRLRPDEGYAETQVVWTPWNFVSEVARDPHPAAMLEALIDDVTEKMARSSERAVLSLSGGLDSSLVAAALQRTGRQTDCLTMMTGDGEGDETRFAAMVARGLGFPLVSCRYDLDKVDLGYSAARHLPRPTARSFAQGADKLRNAYAKEHGADLIFAGDGGDNVFCFLQSVLPVLDRLQAQGPSKGLFATIRDMSMLSRSSMFTVLHRAVRRRLRGEGYRWPVNSRFLTVRSIARSAAVIGHPWLDAPPGAALGKAAHVAMLVRSQLYHEAREPGAADVRLPLLAQPLVEYCLRIPTWKWCEGGHNRVMAREAYAGRLPAQVLRRRTKGGADAFCVALVDANLGLIREMLLDGLLARQGLIQTDAIAASLDNPVRSGGDTHRLLALVDAEAWARSWIT